MHAAAQKNSGWAQAGVTPACTLQVFGMRRSGNHAIIDWLMRNAPDAASGGVFYNNCRFGKNPLRAYGSLDVYDAQREVQPHKDITDTARIAEAGAVPMIIISYEDRMPQAADTRQKASDGFVDGDFGHQIIIYRSFLNWSASLLAKLKKNEGFGATDRLRIMSLAMNGYIEGLDRVADARGIVAICYDDWMTSQEYRAGVLAQLDLPERDLDRGTVRRYGGGSSFQRKGTAAEDLDSTARDAAMAGDVEYMLLLWTAAHDLHFMERLIPHFEQDAERLATLAETAKLNIKLPTREVTA
jgi:nitroreductase